MSMNNMKIVYCLLLASILSCSFIASAYTSSEINSEIEGSENVDSYDPDYSKVDDSSDSDPGTSGSTGGTSTKDGDTGGTNDSDPDDDFPIDLPDDLQAGDIVIMDVLLDKPKLFIPGSKNDHAAMYMGKDSDGDHIVLHSSRPCVRIEKFKNLFERGLADPDRVVFCRVKDATSSQINGAINYATSRIGDTYQYDLFNASDPDWRKNHNPDDPTDENAGVWYCSEIVWAAYYNCDGLGNGIDIDKSGWNFTNFTYVLNGIYKYFGIAPYVTPGEIKNDDNVKILTVDTDESEQIIDPNSIEISNSQSISQKSNNNIVNAISSSVQDVIGKSLDSSNEDTSTNSDETNTDSKSSTSDYQAGWNAAVQALLDAGYSDAANYLDGSDQSSSSSDSSESTDSDTSTGGTSSSSGDSDYDSMPQDYGDGDDDDGGSGGSVDNDNDGYDSSVDCDDNDADVHPGAVELLDGKDNDCDGSVDEGSFVLTLDKSSVKRGGSFTATVKFNGNPASGVSVTFHKLVDRTKSTGSSGKVTFNVPVLCTLGSHSVDADRYGKSDSASITVERMW